MICMKERGCIVSCSVSQYHTEKELSTALRADNGEVCSEGEREIERESQGESIMAFLWLPCRTRAREVGRDEVR